jgi:hypothetical protein
MKMSLLKALTIKCLFGVYNAKDLPPTDGKYFYADLRQGSTFGMHYLDSIVGE